MPNALDAALGGATGSPSQPPAKAPTGNALDQALGGSAAAPDANPLASAVSSVANSPAGRGVGSALGNIANAVDLPLALTQGAMADYLHPGQSPHLAQIGRDLQAGGGWRNIPGALANVAENDIYFRKGSLERVMADPSANAAQKAAANFLLHHPWISGAADFATEFVNPGNVLTGEALGRGSRIAGQIAHATPIVGPAIEKLGQGLKATFDRYNPLRQAGGDAARTIGWQGNAALAEARKANQETALSIFGNPGRMGFGGTTRDEQYEILRRYTGGAPRPVARSSGLSDADLTARADQYRQIISETDNLQRSRGMLKSEHEDYFRMRDAYDEIPETARDVAMGGRAPAGVGGAMRYRPGTAKSKVYHTFDDVLAAVAAGKAKLKPDFSPYGQLLAHLNRVSGNVAIDDFMQALTQTDAAREVAFAGATGKNALADARDAAMLRARQIAAGRATSEIARQFGIQPLEVQQITARNFASVEGLRGRLSEVQRGGGLAPIKQGVQNELLPAAGRVGESVKKLANRETGQVGRLAAQGQAVAPSVNRRIAQIHGNAAQNADRVRAVAQRLTQRVGRFQMQALQRGALLYAKMTDPERPIAAAYRSLRDKMADELMSEGDPNSLWSKMRENLTPEGYIQVKGVPGLSSLDRMKFTDVKPEVVKYLTDYGAPREEAEGLGAWIDRFNSLFRIGILTNPLIHPGYNLLWSYLGGGGDAKRLATIFRDSTLDAEAARFGAHAPLGAHPFSSNENRLVQTLDEAVHEGQGVAGKAAAAGDWMATRAADLNRRIVFDILERRMATEMWASLVAKGIDKAKAGESVRRAFGDYGNLTKAEQGISRAFFFYPWTKAVIPFWLKTLATDPKWVTAPSQAILTHNELAGDPNTGKESPFTLYTGNGASGQPQYQSLPLPQKRLEAPLEMASGHPMRAVREAQYHLTPVLGMAARGAEQLFQDPQEPGVTPSDVMFDKDAPLPTIYAQIAKYAVENGVPFEGLIRGAVHGVGEAAGGAPGRALENLAGGFQYGQANPAQQKALNRIFHGFQRRYNMARNIQDPTERGRFQAQLYEAFRQQADAILKASP